MLDFGALPPEINSGRMYAGPGSGPLLAAAAAWDALAAELYSAAASYGSTIEGLTVAPWMGPSSITMAAAVAPYVAWISVTAGQAEQAGAQAKIAAGVYETAFAATVPPPVIEANRALLMSLVATNIFGQNTPAIAATEAHYAEMWAQDAAAMYGYAGSSATASQLAPFSEPPQTTNPSATAAQSAVVAQAAGAAASSDITAQLSQLISLLPSTLQSLATTATATSASAGWDTVLQSITTILANLTGPYSIIGLGAIPGGWWLTFGQILGLAQNAPGVAALLGPKAAAGALSPWMSGTSAQAKAAADQARAAVVAYETAFAAVVPPPQIAANRSQLISLVATNIFGQNTAAIAATEAEYGEMWAQDTMAMFGYASSSATASRLTPFTAPPQTTNPSGLAGQAAATG